MRRQWFFILLSLSERVRHGSGIVRDVLELTDGAMRLWPVTLYGSLDELRQEGWIHELAEPPEGEAPGRSRWFRITPAGRRALATELAQMEQLVRVAQRRVSPI
jgi:DNA-binding PadR family transcriptional regulator